MVLFCILVFYNKCLFSPL
ncbi:hypothetical protein Nmel_000795 [Mimus melanotis]